MVRVFRVTPLVTFCLLSIGLSAIPLHSSSSLLAENRSGGESKDDDADRLFSQAGEAQNNGDFEFAAELWDQFLEKHADDPQALKARHYSGVCRMTLKEYPKAAKAFADVVADKKADSLSQLEESYYYLGWCQFTIGQQGNGNNASLQNAIKTFDRHIEKFKKGKFLDQAYYLKGESLYFLGKKSDSIKAYQKVVSDFKKSASRVNSLYAMGVSQFEINRYIDAEKTFDLFLAEFDKDPLANEVKLFKYECFLQRGIQNKKTDAEASKVLLTRALEGLQTLVAIQDFPKRDEATFNQAICLAQLGDQQKSADLHAKLAEEFTNSAYAVSSRLAAGKLYLRLNDLAKAEKWLALSTKDKTNTEEATHWLCRTLIQSGQAGKAVSLVDPILPRASDKWLVQLKMDRADALYESKETRKESVVAYREIGEKHTKHALAPQAIYNAAFATLDTRDFGTGLELTKSFLENHPSDAFLPDIKYVRAECFLLSKKYPEAEALYADLTTNHKSHANIQSWKVRYGLSLYLQDKYKETVEYLSTAVPTLQQNELIAEATFLTGASEFYQSQYDAAIATLKKAVAFGSKLKQVDEGLILLGQAQTSQTQLDDAVDTFQNLIKNHSGSSYLSQARFLCGQILANQNKHKQAMELFAEVLSDDKTNKYVPYAHYGKGWSLLNQKDGKPEDLDSAVKEFSAVIDLKDHKLTPDSYYSRAVAYRRQSKFKPAVSDIDKCLELKPDFANLVSALYEKGMALSSDNQSLKAIETFHRLVKDFSKDKDADEFHYQLAWAQRSAAKESDAISTFQRITTEFPKSPLAAEAHFHVAEDHYKGSRFDKAESEYAKALAKSKQTVISQKAQYKLAWTKYQQKEYESALAEFRAQSEKFGTGSLADSSKFMVAECLYQKKDFKKALAEFDKIQTTILTSKNTNKTEKAMTCLHAAESANKTRKYDEALKYAEILQSELNDQLFVAETWLEIGNAYRGLKKFEKAISAYSSANRASSSETGAQAGFLIGEVYFDQSQYKEAIRQYKLVIYGFGGSRASDKVKKWQCGSGYEVARCYHVQIKDETDPEKRRTLINEAIKFYQYVVKNHATDQLAGESRKQLEMLAKVK